MYDYKAVERGFSGAVRLFVFRVARRLRLTRARDPFAAMRRRAYERLRLRMEAERGATDTRELAYRPVISVVMPTHNTPERFLVAAIESVRAQSYERWELCVADDASTLPHVGAMLRLYADADARIKVAYLAENGHISRASNAALQLATGDFVALLDHDDVLDPDALALNVRVLNDDPTLDLLYSDEDKLDERGRHSEPFFKPGWSPETLLSRMYLGHLSVYRRSIVEQIGGFRTGFEGSQDYDLALRFTERTELIRHVPHVLYSWRMHANSTASVATSKDYAYSAAVAALEEALVRRGEAGSIERVPDHPGLYIPRFVLNRPGGVSVIVRAGAESAALAACIASIRSSTWRDCEVVVVSTAPRDDALHAIAGGAAPSVRVVHVADAATSFDAGAAVSTGDYIVLMHGDARVRTPSWLELLMEHAQRPQIGAVGAKLVRPDGHVDQAGLCADVAGRAARIHHGEPTGTSGYLGELITLNNYAALSSAALMVRRAAFDAAGGYAFAGAASPADADLAFGARLRGLGLRNVFVPTVVLEHDGPPALREAVFAARDPIFSPYLAVRAARARCAAES